MVNIWTWSEGYFATLANCVRTTVFCSLFFTGILGQKALNFGHQGHKVFVKFETETANNVMNIN